MKKRIMVALSGGIDSSVSAFLLKKNGFYIEGAFMKNWEENNYNYCTYKKNLYHVNKFCDYINIKLNILNFSKEYWEYVFNQLIIGYKSNITPNPDIICNKKIKFNIFLDYCIKHLNFNFIATGHYARIIKIKNDKYIIKKSYDKKKDQTYFLHKINKGKLKYIIFPLGNYDKKTIKNIAKKNKFSNYLEKESMGICFIGKRKFKHFLKKYININCGDILTIYGKKIGKHDGLFFYTIGQRKGIGIGSKKYHLTKPWYVISKNKNQLIVTQNITFIIKNILVSNMYLLYSLNYINYIKCTYKIRHTYIEKPCILFRKRKYYKIIFKKFCNSIATGQSISFYKKNLCIGGGIINRVNL